MQHREEPQSSDAQDQDLSGDVIDEELEDQQSDTADGAEQEEDTEEEEGPEEQALATEDEETSLLSSGNRRIESEDGTQATPDDGHARSGHIFVMPTLSKLRLDQKRPKYSQVKAPLDMPSYLSVQHKDQKDDLPDDLKSFRESFAKAAQSGKSVYEQVIQSSAHQVREVEQLSSRLASMRAAAFESSLSRLAENFEQAIFNLSSAEASAIVALEDMVRGAKDKIENARGNARGVIRARHTQLTAALSGHRGNQAAVNAAAQTNVSEIETGSTAAAQSMTGLQGQPALAHLDPSKTPYLTMAQNELIDRFIPAVAGERSTYFTDEGASHVERLNKTKENVAASLTAAFSQFDNLLETLRIGGDAPDASDGAAAKAIDTIAANATKGADDAKRKIKRAIQKVRKEGEESLVTQYKQSREAVAANAQNIADQEIGAQEKSVNGAIMGYDGLAFAQGLAISGLHDEIEKKAYLPKEDFARFVVQSAKNARGEAMNSSRKQLGKMVKTSEATRMGMSGQAASSRDAIGQAATRSSEQLLQSAENLAETLRQQVSATQSNFDKMPKPVTDKLNDFPIPAGQAMIDMLFDLNANIGHAQAVVNAAYNGVAAPEPPTLRNPPESSGDSEAPEAPTFESEDPTTKPVDFAASAHLASTEPVQDTKIAKKQIEAKNAMKGDIQTRNQGMLRQMTLTGQSPEATVDLVRGITNLQGWALREAYGNSRKGKSLWDDIPYYISFGNPLTGLRTRVYYGRAVQNYLQGNNTEGARYELQGATTWWNDTAQIDKLMEAQSAEQMEELFNLPDPEGIMDSVRDDLDDTSQQVFDEYKDGNVSGAKALRLEEAVEAARDIRGNAGADQAYDVMDQYYARLGRSRLEGDNPYNLMGGELHVGDPPTPEEAESRRQEQWNDLVSRFGNEGQARTDEEGGLAAGQQALINDLTEQRVYYDQASETVVQEGVSADQERLLRESVLHGPNSPRARAAQIMVEEGRPGGAKRERVEHATDFNGLNDDLANPDAAPLQEGQTDPSAEARQRALQQREEMMQAYDGFHREGDANPTSRSIETIREEMGQRLRDSAGDDTRLGNLLHARATMDPHDPQVAVLAFEDAVERYGTLEDELRRQFGRMSRDQIEEAVTLYDSRNNPGLYERLGIFEHAEGWMPTELSGDDANDMQVAAMGVPRNDREKFEVARMQSKIQIDDSTAVGRWLASEEADRMQDRYDDLRAMGGDDLSFNNRGEIIGAHDAQGNAVNVGNFDAHGDFNPPTGSDWDSHALGLMISANQSATDQYKQATDSIANIITTSLVVAAAVISTALTGGGAASIWIPVLLTAGAGVAGMAVNYAIKGGRYGYEDMARDFASTIVQTATAGLGAAAGVYMAGGKTALQAVSSRMMVADDVLARFLQVGGKGAMRNLGLADELLIGGMTGIVGGAGNAAMDDRAWDRGEWGSEFGHHLMKGMIGGVIGAGAGRTGNMLGGSNPNARQMLGRSIGGGLGGGVSRLGEIAYDKQRGKYRGTFSQAMDEAAAAGWQGGIQSLLETGAEQSADRSARNPNSRMARLRDRLQRTRVGRPGRPGTSSGAERTSQPTTRRRGEVPHGWSDPETMGLIRSDPELSSALDAMLMADQLGVPLHPDMVPTPLKGLAEAMVAQPGSDSAGALVGTDQSGNMHTDGAGEASAIGPSRDAANDNDLAMDFDIDADAAVLKMMSGDDGSELPNPQNADTDGQGEAISPITRSFAEHASANDNSGRRIKDIVALDGFDLASLRPIPENSVIMHPDSTSFDAANDNYVALVGRDPGREVGVFYDPTSGMYAVVQGGSASVSGFGAPWQTIRHFHPQHRSLDLTNPKHALAQRIPTGADGDFDLIIREARDGNMDSHASVIDYIDANGNWQQTVFGVERSGDGFKLYVESDHPVSGAEFRQEFGDMDIFHDWATRNTGFNYAESNGPNAPPIQMQTGPDRRVGGASPRHQQSLTETNRADANSIRQILQDAGGPELISSLLDLQARGSFDAADRPDADLSAAHDLVHALGLVGEPDSMVRLSQILSDRGGGDQAALSASTKALIADATLSATREFLQGQNKLGPGEPLFMLLHGLPASQLQSYAEHGIDLRLTQGHALGDDVGLALYGSLDPQSAELYTERSGPVLPAIARESDLGNILDIRSGSDLHEQWTDYIRENPPINDNETRGRYRGGRVRPGASTDDMLSMDPVRLILYEKAGRQEMFEHFLSRLSGAQQRPDFVMANLGDVVTSGTHRQNSQGHPMETNQFGIRVDSDGGQAIADLFNTQHGFGQGRDAIPDPVGPSARMATGDSGEQLELNFADPSERLQSDSSDQSPEQSRISPDIDQAVEMSFARTFDQETSSSTIQDTDKTIDNINDAVDSAVSRFATGDGPDQAALAELMTLAPEAVAAALRSRTNGISEAQQKEVRAALGKSGMSDSDIEFQIDQLTQIARADGPLQREIAIAAEAVAWREYPDIEGDIGLVAASVERQITERGFEKFANKVAVGSAGPEMRALLNIDSESTIRAVTGDGTTEQKVEEYRQLRAEQGATNEDINAEIPRLRLALADPELAATLADVRTTFGSANSLIGNPAELLAHSPHLLALARTNPDYVRDRIAREVLRLVEKRSSRPLTGSRLDSQVRRNQNAIIKPIISEIASAQRLTNDLGLTVLKADVLSRGVTNAPGLDFIGIRPHLDADTSAVQIFIADDKATNPATGRLNNVSAMVGTALPGNLRSAAADIETRARQLHGADENIPAAEQSAIRQMRDAAAALEIMHAGPVEATRNGERRGTPRIRRLAYAEKVAKILAQHNISFMVTTELGTITELADWLTAYGFTLVND